MAKSSGYSLLVAGLSQSVLMILFLQLLVNPVFSQIQDNKAEENSYSYGWQVRTGIATATQMPFWMYSNQRGQIDKYSANAIFNFFGEWNHTYNSGISLESRANLLLRASDESTVHLNEGYFGINYGGFNLWAGRKYENFGFVHPRLSTGSMEMSNNARPLPQIVFETDGFMPVPFFGGILFADASLGHGWFTQGHGWIEIDPDNIDPDFELPAVERDRYDEGVVHLHRKHLYLRIFNENAPLVLHGGLVHMAQWGGKSTSPVNFSSFLDVFFSRASDSTEILSGGQLDNSSQNHFGVYDFAILVNLEEYTFALTRQFILEDTPNARFGAPWDGLWGLTLKRRAPNTSRSWRNQPESYRSTGSHSRLHQRPDANFRPFLKTIHYEYLDLMEGMSRFPHRPRDEYFNYYNHWIYRAGWTYFNQSIGNSLVTTDPNYLGVVNNEIIGHHIGLEGYAGKVLDWRFFATYTRNYGANRVPVRNNPIIRDTLITERRDQWSFMLFMGSNRLFENVQTEVSLAFDFGQLHPANAGIMLSLRWTP